jgi:arginyl-tRNA synthetase
LKDTSNPPKAPRDVANAIVAALPSSSLIGGTSLAGPGFINVKISKELVAQRITDMLVNGIAAWAPSYKGKGAAYFRLST